jgi:hypothetical protein
MRARRIPSLVLLAGALVAALVVHEPSGPPTLAPEELVQAGVAMPAASPAGTLSSTWFCAGGTADDDGELDHVVTIANPGTSAVDGTLTVLGGRVAAPPAAGPDADLEPDVDDAEGDAADDAAEDDAADDDTADDAAEDDDGEGEDPAEDELTAPIDPVAEPIEVPARGRLQVRLGDLLEAPLAGAVVELAGGEVAVEHTVAGELGASTAPCATTAAGTWTFPWGVTSRGNRQLLVFMNPFPDDATLDVAFATSEGARQIGRFDGFVVPARSVVGAYVDEDTRREQVSAQVRLRSGRVVVDRIQSFDGTDDRRGVTVGLGAPTAAETWHFADGAPTASAVTEQIVVFNPTERTAEVEVEVRPAAGESGEEDFVEPFSLTVAPARYALLDVSGDSRLEHLQDGTPHATVVRSLNRVPVVAERVLAWPADGDDDGSRRGIAATLGAPLGAPSWLLPIGGPTSGLDQWVTVLNLSEEAAVTVSVTGLADGQPLAVADLQGLEVPAGGRLAVRVGEHVERGGLPLLVEATGPVVVERGLYRVGGTGASTTMGIPVAVDVVVPLALPEG